MTDLFCVLAGLIFLAMGGWLRRQEKRRRVGYILRSRRGAPAWTPPPKSSRIPPPREDAEVTVLIPRQSRADRRFCKWAAAHAEPANDAFDRSNRLDTVRPPVKELDKETAE